eukprot:2984560-Pyramimonas_sp.AAC.1
MPKARPRGPREGRQASKGLHTAFIGSKNGIIGPPRRRAYVWSWGSHLDFLRVTLEIWDGGVYPWGSYYYSYTC